MAGHLLNLRTLALLIVAILATTSLDAADEKPITIQPEEARQHIDQYVQVTFEVKKSKDAKHRKAVFLDSEEDFHDEKNLGIAIDEQGIKDMLQKLQIVSPADYFLHKTIRVTGKVSLKDERPYLNVSQATQIEEMPQPGAIDAVK